MKKIFIGGMSLALCFALTACGTAQTDATLTDLSHQLDKTSSTINNVKTIDTSDLEITSTSLEKFANQESKDTLSKNVENAQNVLLNESYYKNNILERTARIKNALSNPAKLSKAQNRAVRDLSNNLSLYTNSVSYSKSDMEKSLATISSLKKHASKNYDRINARLNTLSNNANARSSYYENIINTLEQLEENLKTEIDANSDESITNQTTLSNDENSCEDCNIAQKNNISNDNIMTLEEYPSNIETEPSWAYYGNKRYYPNTFNRYERYTQSGNLDTYGPTTRNIDTFINYNHSYANQMQNPYIYNNGMYYNNPAAYNNGYGFGMGNYVNNRGMNNGLYGMQNPMTNPYAYPNSNNTNRLAYSNNSVVMTGNDASKHIPEQPRLEDFEIIGDDNTVEKISSEVNVNNTTQTDIENNSENKEEITTRESLKITQSTIVCDEEGNCTAEENCICDCEKCYDAEGNCVCEKDNNQSPQTRVMKIKDLRKNITPKVRNVDARKMPAQNTDKTDHPTKAF